jgi:hypothetical protein
MQHTKEFLLSEFGNFVITFMEQLHSLQHAKIAMLTLLICCLVTRLVQIKVNPMEQRPLDKEDLTEH